jgi:HD-GYP domain-containing protein (c-di-GMP phosphodiesterase class II)
LDKHIHRKLIIRLLLVSVILSILIGVVVYFIEIKKVDEYVVGLAMEESQGFVKGNTDYLNSPDPFHRELLRQESWKHIQEKHFVMVELYDRNKQKIVEVLHPDSQSIEEKINKHRLDIFMADAMHYVKFYGAYGQIYLSVLIPLKVEQTEIIGYFNGVYEVGAKTMSEIKNRITFSLIQVVFIVFFTAAVIYPIVIALNRNLIKLMVDLSHANIGMLKVLGSAIAKRDSDTNIHNYRVTIYAIHLAEATGLKR